MNKGLKVLSGVLALTIGLATAGLVSAEENKLSKGAQAILKVEEPAVPEYKFYESITLKPEYAALLKKGAKEYEGLKADSAEWARLSTIACNAAQGIESINNQLDAIPHFLSLASDMGETKTGVVVYGLNEEENATEKTKMVSIPEYSAGLLLMTPENHQLSDLLKANAALKEKVDAGKDAGGNAIWTPATYAEQLKANVAEIAELVKYVATRDYQDAAKYVANYTEEMANAQKAKLLKEKTDLNGLIAFVTKIANDNGLKLMDKCALPQGADVSEADKAASGEAKKDTVPNTGAEGETQPTTSKPEGTTEPATSKPAPVVEKSFVSSTRYFVPLVPTKVVKVVKVEKKTPAFTFEALNKLELLPRAQKTEVVVEVEAPAFTFEALNKLELLPRR